jgi:hypothetical protein
VFGGNVAGTNGDPVPVICEKLFPVLVGDSVTDEADKVGRELQQADLKRVIKKDFESLGILAGRVRDVAPHPIWVAADVIGKRTTHKPSFFQAGQESCVMEVINFATPKKASATWHAGFVATMFDDIVQKPRQSTIKRAVLVRATDEDLADKAVKYAFDLTSVRLTIEGLAIKSGETWTW